MPILTITNDDGTEELVRVKLGPLEPSTAAITVLNALAGIKAPRTPRSDRGTSRKKIENSTSSVRLNGEQEAKGDGQ